MRLGDTTPTPVITVSIEEQPMTPEELQEYQSWASKGHTLTQEEEYDRWAQEAIERNIRAAEKEADEILAARAKASLPIASSK